MVMTVTRDGPFQRERSWSERYMSMHRSKRIGIEALPCCSAHVCECASYLHERETVFVCLEWNFGVALWLLEWFVVTTLISIVGVAGDQSSVPWIQNDYSTIIQKTNSIAWRYIFIFYGDEVLTCSLPQSTVLVRTICANVSFTLYRDGDCYKTVA